MAGLAIAAIVVVGRQAAGLGIGDQPSFAALCIALWMIAVLAGRPQWERPAAALTLLAGVLQGAVSSHDSPDALAGVLATTALAAAAGTLVRMLKRDADSAPCFGSSAAAGYVAVAAMWFPDARLSGALAGVAILLPLCVSWLLLDRAGQRGAISATRVAAASGIGIVLAAIAGALTGAPFLAGFAPGAVTMPIESALALLTLLAAVLFQQFGRRRLALVMLAPVGVLCLFVIAERELDTAATLSAAAAPAASFTLEWWLQQRLQTVPAIVLFAAASAIGLGSLLGRHPIAATIAWLAGITLFLVAMLSLLATLIGSPYTMAELGAQPAAVPSALAMLALGTALLLRDPGRAGMWSARSVWIPLLAALTIGAAAVQLFMVMEGVAAASTRRDAAAALEGVEGMIRSTLWARASAAERLAQRLLIVSPDDRRRLFLVETEQAAQGGSAIESIAWVGADRVVRAIYGREDLSHLLGRNAAFDAVRKNAYDLAESSGRTVAIGPLPLSRIDINAILVITPGHFGDGPSEFLTTALRIEDLLGLALRDIAQAHAIDVEANGAHAFARGVLPDDASRPGNLTREFEALDSRWKVRVAPLPGGRGSLDANLRRALLWFGMLIAALVSLALRFAGLARERALVAEAVGAALRDESHARELSQAALARSENNANRLLEGMSDGVVTVDRDLRVTYVNARAREVMKRLTAEPVGCRLPEIFPHFADSEFARKFAWVMDNHKPAALEAYSPGVGLWLTGRLHPVDGGLTAIFEDTTELRQAHQFEGRQRAVLQAIATGRPLVDCVEMSVLLFEGRFSGAIATVLRYDEQGNFLYGGIGPSLPRDYVERWEGAVPGPGPGACSCGAAVYRRARVVVEDIASDPLWEGHREPALALGLRACWSQPIMAADGRVLGSFAVYYRSVRGPSADESAGLDAAAALVGIALERDLSARRIDESRQRFRSLFERSPYSIFAHDLNGVVVDCNENATLRGGLERDAIVGKPFDGLIATEMRAMTRDKFAAAARGVPQSYETIALLASKQRRNVQVTNVPIVVEQRIVGVFGIVQDITEARQMAADLDRALQDLQLRNRELQDFAFVASHDLQEPLRKVQAFSDRLIKRFGASLDSQGIDYLQRIDGAAHRMQVLIDDLLAYSRITSQGQPFGPVDMDVVAAEVLSDLEVRIEESHAEVTLGELPRLHGDRTQLRQLLQNLVANALKFRDPGRKPLISIRAVPGKGTEPMAVLIVEDNGIGFDEVYRERIFVPFQRLHGRSEYEGTGIGLAVVRKIVERHGGRIVARGRPGEGARFDVVLPMEVEPG